MSRIVTVVAVLPALLFHLMIIDYVGGGSSGDQLIKLGVATHAIWIAWPIACLGLLCAAWDRFRHQMSLAMTAVVCGIDLVVIASPLMYLLL